MMACMAECARAAGRVQGTMNWDHGDFEAKCNSEWQACSDLHASPFIFRALGGMSLTLVLSLPIGYALEFAHCADYVGKMHDNPR